MHRREPDLNIIQAGATQWVWDRLGDALIEHLDGDVFTTPRPLPGAKRYFFLCPEYFVMSTEEMWPRSTILVNHFEPGQLSVEAREGLLKAAGRVVTLNKETAKIVNGAGVKARTIGFGVDLETFRPGLRMLDHNQMVIGVCGRNYETARKNPEAIFHLAQILGEKLPAKFLFCGRGWEPVQKAINAETQATAEIWIGSGKYDTYPKFYRALDALLITSHVEGGPYAPMEALASGVPVVSTPVGWMPQLAKDSPGVRIYGHGNIAMASAIMLDLLTRRPSPQIIRASVAHMTWRSVAREYSQLFGMKLKEDRK